MKIKEIHWKLISCGLKKPFITALRTLNRLEVIQVEIISDTGVRGIGGCAPTAAITGETIASIIGALEYITPLIIGMDCSALEPVLHVVQTAIVGNTSAKSALDIALHDLYTVNLGIPLYNYLGGSGEKIRTDLTVSLNSAEEMAADARSFIDDGIGELKLKVGGKPEDDIQRILAVREAAGSAAVLRLDANQGWTPGDAVRIVNSVERRGAALDFIEQPVAAHDFKGMRFVRENISVPLVADESVFSPFDALRLIELDAADGINIKFAKCGGIAPAVKIASLAETAGLFCMIGCMMESHAGITAAAHFGSAVRNVKYADLDVPLLCSEKTEGGGVTYNVPEISFPDKPGLGMVI